MTQTIQNHIKNNSKELLDGLKHEQRPKIVVVGGGFAGINFIKSLKKEKVQIILIDKNNYHTFQPLMYQVATAGLEPGSISSSLRALFDDQKNIQIRMAKATAIDAENNQLITTEGKVSYDYLVLANGSTGNFFGNKEVKENALTLNCIQDALTIREQFIENFEEALLKNRSGESELMNIVIVGAGPTGVELAGALAELKNVVLPHDYPDYDTNNMTIFLVEAKSRLLPTMDEFSGRKAKKYLKSLGVTVKTDKMVKNYSDYEVTFSDGTKIKTNLLIWAAGVKGNLLDGFIDEQIENGSLRVDEYNRVFHSDNIYAIGDVAYQPTENYTHGLPNLAQVAIQQGSHLAKNLIRTIKNKKPKPFSYNNKGVMATIGRHKAVVEFPGAIKLGGKLGWLIWVFVHLFSIMGLRRKLAVMAHWAWSYFNYDKGNRLILKHASK